MVVAGILFLIALIVLIEIPFLKGHGLNKELWVYIVLLLFGVSLSVAQSLHVNLPNPTEFIIAAFKPLSDALFHVLK